MTFFALATQLDKQMTDREAVVANRSLELDKQASLQATTQAGLEEERLRLQTFERDINARNEEVTRKEINVRRDDEVKADLQKAAAEREGAAREKKAAVDALSEAQQILAEIAKRELALSEREKTYKAEVELDVMRRFAFGK